MGFFSLIGRAISGTVKKIGNTVGTAVEKIGEVVHSNAIEMAGFKLQCACDFGENSWSTSSSVEQTVDVHKELSMIIKDISPQAEEAEEDLIQICVKEIGKILDNFLTIAQEITVPTELLRIKETYEADIRTALSGQAMKYAQPRLSLDDSRCTEILKIQDSSERKKKASEFKEEVLKSAEEQFKQLCLGEKRKYCEQMLEQSENLLKASKLEYEVQKKLLDRMLQENKDEVAIDLDRVQVLLSQEKLVLLSAIAFEQE